MTEEKQEKKKRRIVKRVLRWIWLGILTLLILAALIYDAPWKVLALLLILLAAHTILPKGAVKWFWLSVAAVVVILVIWVFLPDENGDWRPYIFEEDLAALNAKYAIPDSENAALLYSKLFETLDTDSNAPEFFIESASSSQDEPWQSADHPETADWLKAQQGTIESLLQISKMDKCQFPLPATPWDVSFDHYSKMRRCAFLLVSSANNDIAEGRTDAGLEKYLCLTQMAKHLYQQPAMVDFFVGYALENLALTRLNRFMIEGEPSKEQIQLVANSIKEMGNNWGSDFAKRLEYEKLYEKNTICCLTYQRNSQGKARLNRDTTSMLRNRFPEKNFPPSSYWQRKFTKASVVILGWFFMPSTPQKASRIFDECYEKYDAMAEPNFDWTEEPKELTSYFTQGKLFHSRLNYRYFANLITDMAAQTYYSIHGIYLRHLAERRGSRLLVAIKQHQIENGAWPANLDVVKSLAPAESLIDPVSGKQFEYETSGKYFSLYGETINIWPR